jgi:hypothetical protein
MVESPAIAKGRSLRRVVQALDRKSDWARGLGCCCPATVRVQRELRRIALERARAESPRVARRMNPVGLANKGPASSVCPRTPRGADGVWYGERRVPCASWEVAQRHLRDFLKHFVASSRQISENQSGLAQPHVRPPEVACTCLLIGWPSADPAATAFLWRFQP